MARRGVDWEFDSTVRVLRERYFKKGKAPGEKLTIFENFATGFFGGAFSAFNHPLDVWVANCQKHREGTHKCISSLERSQRRSTCERICESMVSWCWNESTSLCVSYCMDGWTWYCNIRCIGTGRMEK